MSNEKQSHANNDQYQYNEHIKLTRLNNDHYSYQTTHMLHLIKETNKLKSHLLKQFKPHANTVKVLET